MDELLPEFVAETRETLQAVADALVAWERTPADQDLLNQIFRFVHTVKGSCGFLDLPRLQRLSHAAEDALADARAGRRVPDAAFVGAVLAVVDRIGDLAEAIETGAAVPDGDEPALMAALQPAAAPPPKPLLAVRGAGPRAASRSIRLSVDLLDRMMGSVSDMVLARNELARELGGAGEGAFERLSLCVRELREAVTRARMSRIDALFAALPRLVRDLSAELGKQVDLVIDGGEVELDREMIEQIRDPLTHLIRNAIDHGIEPPTERLRAGKPAAGQLLVTARQSGNRINISVTDDGAGIDIDRVVEKAVATGAVAAPELAAMSRERRLDLIFAPGLTTRATATSVSGRGVGMDIVRANIDRLGGTVQVASEPGQGTRLFMAVPLTLSIMPALTVGIGPHRLAVARGAIDEIVRVGAAAKVAAVGSGLIADIRGVSLPVADLRRLLAPADAAVEPRLLVLVRTPAGGRFALAVSEVHDHEELVIKPAAPAVMASGLFAGVTLPDNSGPMLLLDMAGVAAAAGVRPAAPAPPTVMAAHPTAPTLLFVDGDGVERGVRLAEVDRIEEVPATAVLPRGGHCLLVHAGQLRPLYRAAPIPERASLVVLRLRVASGEATLLIDRVVDVVSAGLDLLPAIAPGRIAGVLLHAGRAVEMIDVAWLAADLDRAVAPRPGPDPLLVTADPVRPPLVVAA